MSVATVVSEITEAIQVIKAFKELRTELADALGLDANESILDAIKEIRTAITSNTDATAATPAASA